MTLTARGFVPDQKVRFELHSEPHYELGESTADNSGVATLKNAVIPEEAKAGGHHVYAIDTVNGAKTTIGFAVKAKETKPDTKTMAPKPTLKNLTPRTMAPRLTQRMTPSTISKGETKDQSENTKNTAKNETKNKTRSKHGLATSGTAVAGLVVLVVFAALVTSLLLWHRRNSANA